MVSRAGRDPSGDQTTLGARISIERSTDHHKISGGASRNQAWPLNIFHRVMEF